MITPIPDTHNPQAKPVTLNCCNGAAPPEQLVEGWRRFLDLPRLAQASVWTVLGPGLLTPADPGNQQRVEKYCAEHGLTQDHAVAAMQACEFLVRQASAINLELAKFQEDLAAMSGDQREGYEIITTRYEGIKNEVRKVIVNESLADHGKVLLGLNWRVDHVKASHRGAQLDTDVVMLTFCYREGDRADRVSLQLTREAMLDLKQFCERFTT